MAVPSVHRFLQTLSSIYASCVGYPLRRAATIVAAPVRHSSGVAGYPLRRAATIVAAPVRHSSGVAGYPLRRAATIVAAPMRHSSGVVAEHKASGSENGPVPVSVVYGAMRGVKSSPMKLNLVAKLIRGMRVCDAIIQMELSQKKASKFVLTTLLDTQRRAELHGLDPVNLHVAQSYVGKGQYLKRIRYHGRGMHGLMHKYYAHYFLMLKPGRAQRKKRTKEDRKSFKTKKLIEAGPRSIPNSL